MSVIFDQLRISDDGKRMYINAHVNKADCFDNVSIEKLYICLGSQIYETLTIDPESNGFIYSKDYSEGTREINECISISDDDLAYAKTDFSRDLFFVYVKCTNVPEECRCLMSVGNYVLGVTFDVNMLHQAVMGYTKDFLKDCTIPTGFSDFILLWNAFKAAVETEHYIPAIKFYNMLFGIGEDGKPYGPYGRPSVVFTKPCGCHG